MHSLIQKSAIILMKKKAVKNITTFEGEDSVLHFVDSISDCGFKSVFLVSSKTVIKNNMLEAFFDKLNTKNIKITIFNDILSEPTISDVEKGLSNLIDGNCDCVVAIGGGSVIDCAKVIALRAANQHLSVKNLSSYLCNSKTSLPLFIAPTTSGTGSEITYFSVITEEESQKKLAILSDKFLPMQIAFDFNLIKTVPQNTTIYSGLDALTHSIESYISTFSDEFLDDTKNAPLVVKMIFENLPKASKDPENFEARMNMAKAAYLAGINFRRASVGFVHAIAHRIGETYHIPHGLACATLLPHVLKASLPHCSEKLDKMAIESGIADNAAEFIEKIIEFEKSLGIDFCIEKIDKEDYYIMIKRAISEAKIQGIPKLLDKSEVTAILDNIKIGNI